MAKKRKDPTKLHLNKVNFKSNTFLKRLGKALVSAGDTDFGSATVQLLGVEKNETNEYKMFWLIISALGESCRSILQRKEEHQNILDDIPNLSGKATGLRSEIKSSISDLELSIDASFFSAPHKSEFIYEVQNIFQLWLYHQIKLTEAQSKSLSVLLPLEFLKQLTSLWADNPNEYKSIEEYFKNPFFKALFWEGSQAKYYLNLLSLYSQPVFGSPKMTLADIYVEPNFKVYKKCLPENRLEELVRDSDGFYNPDYTKGSLHNYIIEWLSGNDPLDLKSGKSNFTILLGQPGQGKTSFCARVIYDLLSNDLLNNDNLYFVRLRYIVNVKDAINNPLEAIRKHIAKKEFKSDNLIDLKELNHAILILDGLDELYMHQGLTNSDIKDLVKNLSVEVDSNKSLRILLTTRYNYLNINDLSGEKYLILKLDKLSLNQQLRWLAKYKVIYKKCSLNQKTLKTISASKENKYKGIKELINQPILLQMIAQSDLDVTEGSNRAKIYETLFDNVIGRRWSGDGQLDKYAKLEKKDMRAFLQTIALTIYHSDFEYIRRNEFENNELLAKAKDQFLKKADNQLSFEDALKDILVSFYFKNKKKKESDKTDEDRHNEYAIEFLHKSLQEYLVAEKIWSFFKSAFLRQDKEDNYFIDDWKNALKEIHPIVSSKMLSIEIVNYLIEIMRNDEAEEEKKILALRLDLFLPELIKRDFLYQFDVNRDIQPFNQGLSNFYVYWTILSYLRTNNMIPEALRDRFLLLIKSIKNLFHNANINLGGTHLGGADLGGVNLGGANLIGTDLGGASLVGAHLVGAHLVRAHLGGADLVRANLVGANLGGANLVRANLGGANLGSAHLVRANLGGTNLGGAIGLKVDQLIEVKTLRGCIGLPSQIEAELRKRKPSLFE